LDIGSGKQIADGGEFQVTLNNRKRIGFEKLNRVNASASRPHFSTERAKPKSSNLAGTDFSKLETESRYVLGFK
jgi:hypothetical protein